MPLFGRRSTDVPSLEADVAVVGGSFVPKGGQNPNEPAAMRLPVLFGPSIEHPDDRQARTHSRFVLAAEQFLRITKTTKEVDQVRRDELLPGAAHRTYPKALLAKPSPTGGTCKRHSDLRCGV